MFNAVRAPRKVAVDLHYQFDVAAASADPVNGGATFHEVTSDHYFAALRGDEQFDVIFVDGLHTFDQTLRDLLNATYCLKPGGVIVVDDVMPYSYAASLPSFDESRDLREMTGDSHAAWMGDVYRLVFFIRDYMPAFTYASVEENHGQTVLWRATRAHDADVAPLGVEAISRLEYKDAILQKRAFAFQSFTAIEERVRAARAV